MERAMCPSVSGKRPEVVCLSVQPPAPLRLKGLVAEQGGAGAGHKPQDEGEAGDFPLGG